MVTISTGTTFLCKYLILAKTQDVLLVNLKFKSSKTNGFKSLIFSSKRHSRLGRKIFDYHQIDILVVKNNS